MNGGDSDTRYSKVYAAVYENDLVYRRGCWSLCGDAHCCHFSRYKLPEATGFHEIPLLPGERTYLERSGNIRQYAEFRELTFDVRLSAGILRYESLLIRAAQCPCSHDIRPTVCRLYPLLPVYSPDRQLIGVETHFTVYDVIEEALGLPRTCRIEQVPLQEIGKFARIAQALGSDPVLVFYLTAYKLVKDAFRQSLLDKFASEGTPGESQQEMPEVFSACQQDMMLGKLVSWSAVKADLEELGNTFSRLHGTAFALPQSENP